MFDSADCMTEILDPEVWARDFVNTFRLHQAKVLTDIEVGAKAEWKRNNTTREVTKTGMVRVSLGIYRRHGSCYPYHSDFYLRLNPLGFSPEAVVSIVASVFSAYKSSAAKPVANVSLDPTKWAERLRSSLSRRHLSKERLAIVQVQSRAQTKTDRALPTMVTVRNPRHDYLHTNGLYIRDTREIEAVFDPAHISVRDAAAACAKLNRSIEKPLRKSRKA